VSQDAWEKKVERWSRGILRKSLSKKGETDQIQVPECPKKRRPLK